MINHKTNYLETARQIKELIKDIVNEDELNDFVSTVNEKVQDFKPSLMLYGTYNSGKSTLLNALYGEKEKAITGDAPETAEVIAYDWNGYIIYDTPGIDAPIEHERITQEHIKKTEIVLFVMSGDGAFEERYIYEKIIEIVSSNKPLLIILNNKVGMTPDSEELADSISTINQRLIEISEEEGIKNIEEKVRIFWVDAETALSGKIENETLLIDDSNILIIEDEINKVLQRSGSGEVLQNLNRYIVDFISMVIQKIDNKMDNSSVRNLEEQITRLNNEQNQNYVKIKNFLDTDIQVLGNEIKDMLLDGDNEDEINSYANTEIENISNKIEQHIDHINNVLIQEEEAFSESVEGIELSKKIIQTLKNENDDSTSENEHFQKIKDQLRNGITDKQIVKDTSIEMMKFMRKLGVKGFKWRWGSTFNKWGDKIAKGLGPTVRVVSALYEGYQTNESHNKMVEEKKKFAQYAKNEADKLTNGIKQEVDSVITETLNSLYRPIIKQKNDQVSILSDKNKESIKAKESLFSLRRKVL